MNSCNMVKIVIPATANQGNCVQYYHEFEAYQVTEDMACLTGSLP